MNVDDRLLYAQGALAAKEYLHKARMNMKVHRLFEPHTLRFHYEFHVRNKALEYQAGFMDAIGAFMLSALDGVTVDLFRWEVLQVLDRAKRNNNK
jgi:hypothetical protein